MITIPLPFVIALAVGALLLYELADNEYRLSNPWLICFFAMFAFQAGLFGLRFGHGVEWLKQIQPYSAAFIPPLAYLGFRRPQRTMALLILALPILAVITIQLFGFKYLDFALAAGNAIFAGALIRLGLSGSDALHWVEIRRLGWVTMLLWLVISILVVSAITDAIITYDFIRNNGSNIGSIAGWATVIAILFFATCFVGYRHNWFSSQKTTSDDGSKNAAVFDSLNKMMKVEKLHLDPDINLNRIARRMVLPTREVSRAVNSQTSNNVSQYVNQLRIEEACGLLQSTDMPITQIVFAVGFNTKSNFNREFSRIMKTSPREWREKASPK